jgi:arginyl-tRNA synthetase
VVGTKNEEKLLKLSAMVAVTLRIGLKLMGIEAKYKM